MVPPSDYENPFQVGNELRKRKGEEKASTMSIALPTNECAL